MEHTFDIAVAQEYGILEAVLIRNFQYWISKNKANGAHFVNGHYWTYNSYDALVELFPYATKDQLKKRILRLVEKGVLLIGHFSEVARDRTNWFAFADEDKWIVPNCTMQSAESPNGECESARCINTTTNTTNNKHTNSKPNNIPSCIPPTEDDISSYCNEIDSHIDVKDFINYYNATDWKVQGKPMKNWKLTVQTWTKKDRKDRPWVYEEQPQQRHIDLWEK